MPKRNEWHSARPCHVPDPNDCDPLGSWTGVPAQPYEKPIQDADDL